MLVDIHGSDEMGNVFTLREELVCGDLRVPAGFSSDGASVPRVFWRIIFPPGDQKALRAAFLHDFIYRTHPEGWSRKQADDLFRRVLIEDGISRNSANMAYWGVRLFGVSAWKAGGK